MVTLRSLEKYDSGTANNILAALALSSTANPGVGEAAEVTKAYPAEQAAVLKELLSKAAGDDQAETANRMREMLWQQIHRVSLEGKDSDAILARAGQAGRLSPSLYRIKFIGYFQVCISLGTKTSHVTDAILNADDVQHLEGKTGEKTFSIFLKYHQGAAAKDSFWLLVLAHRDGRDLIVQNAWRVYLSDVDLTTAKKPIDVLRAFANVFGLPIHAAGKVDTFVANETVPIPPGQVIRAYTVKGIKDKAYVSTTSGYNLPGSHKIILAYAIDVSAYEKSLHQHGVRTNAKHHFSRVDEYSLAVNEGGAVGLQVR